MIGSRVLFFETHCVFIRFRKYTLDILFFFVNKRFSSPHVRLRLDRCLMATWIRTRWNTPTWTSQLSVDTSSFTWSAGIDIPACESRSSAVKVSLYFLHYPCSRAVNTTREHGFHFGIPCSRPSTRPPFTGARYSLPVFMGRAHGPCLPARWTGDREHGPRTRPVNTVVCTEIYCHYWLTAVTWLLRLWQIWLRETCAWLIDNDYTVAILFSFYYTFVLEIISGFWLIMSEVVSCSLFIIRLCVNSCRLASIVVVCCLLCSFYCVVCNAPIAFPPYGKLSASSVRHQSTGSTCQAEDGYVITQKGWCPKDNNG